MRTITQSIKDCGMALGFLLCSGCSVYEKTTTEEQGVIETTEAFANQDLLSESGFHPASKDWALMEYRENHIFHYTCKEESGKPSVALVAVFRQHILPPVPGRWEKHAATASLFCKLFLQYGIQRGGPMLGEDALTFVFPKQEHQLHYYYGKRPNEFPYDFGIKKRDRVAPKWDRVTLPDP